MKNSKKVDYYYLLVCPQESGAYAIDRGRWIWSLEELKKDWTDRLHNAVKRVSDVFHCSESEDCGDAIIYKLDYSIPVAFVVFADSLNGLLEIVRREGLEHLLKKALVKNIEEASRRLSSRLDMLTLAKPYDQMRKNEGAYSYEVAICFTYHLADAMRDYEWYQKWNCDNPDDRIEPESRRA